MNNVNQIQVILSAKDMMTNTIEKVKRSLNSLNGIGSKVSKGFDVGKRSSITSITEAIAHASSQTGGFRNAVDDLHSSMTNMNKPAKSVALHMKGTGNSLGSLSEQLKANEGRFQGWAMSIMFAGMAMMRYTQQLWQFGNKAFQEVMHSVEGTTTGFDNLNGSMKYLGFTIGQALEPLAAYLTPIIIKVAEWVQDNEKLVEGIVKWGFVLGTVFFAVGQLVLGFNGLFTAVKNIVSIAGSSMWGKLGAFLMTPAGAGVLALIALGAISWKALKETPEALESVKTSIKNIDLDPLKDALGNVWESMTGLAPSWENVAWVIAWGVDVASRKLQVLINAFALVGNTLAFVFNLAKAAWAAIFGGGDKKKAIEDLNTSLQLMKTNFKDIVTSAVDAWTPESFKDFKARVELEQSLKENPEQMSYAVQSFARPDEFQSREPILIQADTININANSSEEIYQSIETMVR